MGRFSMFIYGCILGNLFTMAVNPLHSESTNGKWLKPKHIAQTISVLNMFFYVGLHPGSTHKISMFRSGRLLLRWLQLF